VSDALAPVHPDLVVDDRTAVLMAGVPATNRGLLHAIRFSVGDPAAILDLPGSEDTGGAPGTRHRLLIIRDIEMGRARAEARADAVRCPADFTPAGGLSGDRTIATAQATAVCVVRSGATRVIADRSLPLIHVHELEQRGVTVHCDPEMGVVARRAKDAEEVAALRTAQGVTEEAMQLACRLVGRADAAPDGTLLHEGEPLTSERVRAAIDAFLLGRGYESPGSIVAGGTQGSDCHAHGHGPLRTGEPVIIDIFPRDRSTGYNGDCTRTVVHGAVPETVARMHAAVVAAKAAATAATRPGATGEDVHAATLATLHELGFASGLPADDDPADRIAMVHGTGHGIGLDVHEPPLLDRGGPPLVVGDALTIEPGLYGPSVGGIRVEDMVIVTEDGCENLNRLPEGLDWT
jgi:Xaa-Pro aminopeptidase